MSPEDVNPEWVEKAARAMADDWNPDRDPILTAMFRDYAASALAAVLPPARAEAWKQGALTADPNLDPSVADEYNPYREGSGDEG